MITCSKCGSRVGVSGPCRKCARLAKAERQRVPDGEVRGLIRHYDRMSKLPGAVNYDKVSALLTELLSLRRAESRSGSQT